MDQIIQDKIKDKEISMREEFNSKLKVYKERFTHISFRFIYSSILNENILDIIENMNSNDNLLV